MADNENVTSKPKSKAKKEMSSRKQHAQRMARRKQKKVAAAAQAVAQTPTETPVESTEPSQEVPVTSTPTPTPNGGAATVPAPVEQAPSTPPPQEPVNAWEKKKATAPAQPQPPRPRQNGDVAARPVRPMRNGHPPLQIPSRNPPPQQQPHPDRSALFGGRSAPPRQPVQPQPPRQKLSSKVSVRDRLKNRQHLIGAAMPEDYVPERRPRVSPRREQQPDMAPVRPRGPPPASSRPTGPRPEMKTQSARQQMNGRRPVRNGRPPQNGSMNGRPPQMNGRGPERRPEPRQETRQKPARSNATRQMRNGSSNRQQSSMTSSPASRKTTSSSKQSLSKSPSTATSSSTSSSPIRRAKKDLRKVGMKKVTNGRRVIKKQTTAVWLDGSISDPALQPSDSKLNPEAPLFESTAILTGTGSFLNDDFYRPNGMMMPTMTQPVPQLPVTQQQQAAVTPAEPDFSQAANNYPSYQQVYPPDMFGSGENYYGYAAQYSMYPPTADGLMSGGPPSHATHVPSQFGAFGNYTPTDFNESYPQFHSTNHPGSGYYPNASGYTSQPAGAYSGVGTYMQQNGMTGVSTGTTSASASQDFSQMMAPTHVPNGVHTNGSVAVVNGNATGTSSTSIDLTGVSSSAVSETGTNANEASMSETFMYDVSSNGGYYASSATM